MLMALGLYLFSVPTLSYAELQRRTDWRHARTGRIGARDATQYTGPGDDTISLTGSAVAELVDGPAEVETLRTMAATGQAWPLVDAAGAVHGNYVILAVDERQRAFLPDGTPRQIDFAIDLLRVDDPAGVGAAR